MFGVGRLFPGLTPLHGINFAKLATSLHFLKKTKSQGKKLAVKSPLLLALLTARRNASLATSENQTLERKIGDIDNFYARSNIPTL